MGSSLGPVLANIILTEFERFIDSELIADGTIKFYKRYVADTLVLIKLSDISAVLAKFNSFVPNFTLTVDTFSEGIVHFLNIKVSVDGSGGHFMEYLGGGGRVPGSRTIYMSVPW